MTDYNYSYNLRLKFANPNKFGLINEHKDYFLYCVDKYNDSAQNARNKKKIKVLNIDSDCIEICLYSNADLTKAPGRALMHLTTLLLNKEHDNYDPYFKQHLYHNKLFYTETFSISKSFESLSDAEFVKNLIDYICKPKSEVSEKDRSTMNRIKMIAIENGLIQ